MLDYGMGSWLSKIIKLNLKKLYSVEDFHEEYIKLRAIITGCDSLENIGTIDQLEYGKNSIETQTALTGKTDGIDGELSPFPDHTGISSKETHLCQFKYIMLTPEQQSIKLLNRKHCVLDGDYGTGKTYVLKVNTYLLSIKSALKSKYYNATCPN